ncbi:hypothetical protein [Nesterenkonia sp. Act20]|uniref:hypothetical protein n=1 Tax=Nesterenkonia sp. Act20 TaxID=1483432 RepID=UPI001C45CD00|nr:hypothetical protein [Nesterenkonia sp. Act20]
MQTTDEDETAEDARVSNATSTEDDQISDQGKTDEEIDEEGEQFPRSYVEKLRDENAKYRQRAQRADELAHELHRSRVEATGRLADPTDLEFSDEHLNDADKLTAAIDELLTRKPHLAARKPSGNIGQGSVTHGTSTVDLAGLLRAGAN